MISALDKQANRQTTVDCARADCSGWSGPMKESESELSALSAAAAAAAAAIRSKPNTQSAAVAASPSPSLPVILKPHFAITLTKALIKTRRNKGRRRGGRGTEPAEGMREGGKGNVGQQAVEGGRPKMELKRYIMTCAMPMPERRRQMMPAE